MKKSNSSTIRIGHSAPSVPRTKGSHTKLKVKGAISANNDSQFIVNTRKYHSIRERSNSSAETSSATSTAEVQGGASRSSLDRDSPIGSAWGLCVKSCQNQLDRETARVTAVYEVRVSPNTSRDSEWVIKRSFEEFYLLDLNLRYAFPKEPLPKLPNKYIFKNGQATAEFAQERTLLLQKYLNTVAITRKITMSDPFKSFVDPHSDRFLSLEEPDIAGVLTKSRALLRFSSKPRFALLKESYFVYYSSDKPPGPLDVPRRVIPLSAPGASVSAGKSGKSFVLTAEGGKKTLTFSAKVNIDAACWITALQSAIAAAKATLASQEPRMPAVSASLSSISSTSSSATPSPRTTPLKTNDALMSEPPEKDISLKDSPSTSKDRSNDDDKDSSSGEMANTKKGATVTVTAAPEEKKSPQLSKAKRHFYTARLNDDFKPSKTQSVLTLPTFTFNTGSPLRPMGTGTSPQGMGAGMTPAAVGGAGAAAGNKSGFFHPLKNAEDDESVGTKHASKLDFPYGISESEIWEAMRLESEEFKAYFQRFKTQMDRRLQQTISSLEVAAAAPGIAPERAEESRKLIGIAQRITSAKVTDMLLTGVCAAALNELSGMLKTTKSSAAVHLLMRDIAGISRIVTARSVVRRTQHIKIKGYDVTGGKADDEDTPIPSLPETVTPTALDNRSSASRHQHSNSRHHCHHHNNHDDFHYNYRLSRNCTNFLQFDDYSLHEHRNHHHRHNSRHHHRHNHHHHRHHSLDTPNKDEDTPPTKVEIKEEEEEEGEKSMIDEPVFISVESSHSSPSGSAGVMSPSSGSESSVVSSVSSSSSPYSFESSSSSSSFSSSLQSSEYSEAETGERQNRNKPAKRGFALKFYTEDPNASPMFVCAPPPPLPPPLVSTTTTTTSSSSITTTTTSTTTTTGVPEIVVATTAPNVTPPPSISKLVTKKSLLSISRAVGMMKLPDRRVVCRNCDEEYPVYVMKEHTEYCFGARAIAEKDASSDSRIQEFMSVLNAKREKLSQNPDFDPVPYARLVVMAQNIAAQNFGDEGATKCCGGLLSDLQTYLNNGVFDIFLLTYGRELVRVVEEKYNIMCECLRMKKRNEKSRRSIWNLFLLSSSVTSQQTSFSSSSSTTGLSIKDFKVIKKISSGAYGEVFLARKRKADDLYAIKRLTKSDTLRKNMSENVIAERRILSSVSNPFVVNLYYAFQDERYLYLVMEYCPGGDVGTLLKNLGAFDLEMTRIYAAEIVLALESMHRLSFVHRDLKPDNLLISATGHIVLTDFGLSSIGVMMGQIPKPPTPTSQSSLSSSSPSSLLSASPTTLSATTAAGGTATPGKQKPKRRVTSKVRIVGTPDYLAPEVLCGLEHGPEVDWWALGVIIFEFIASVPPFNGDSPDEIFDNILDMRIPWPPISDEVGENGECLGFPSVAHDFVEKLLVKDPTKRLGHNGAAEVKAHPFFNGINWDTLIDEPRDDIFVPVLDDPEDTSYFEDHGAVNHDKNNVMNNILASNAVPDDKDTEKFEGFEFVNTDLIRKKNLACLKEEEEEVEEEEEEYSNEK